jgi:hypothetical protein
MRRDHRSGVAEADPVVAAEEIFKIDAGAGKKPPLFPLGALHQWEMKMCQSKNNLLQPLKKRI